MNKVEQFIDSHWEDVIDESRYDTDLLMGVPYPYTIPAVGRFEEMYYWDTYFTNVGLIISGRAALAKNNTDNMLYLVNRCGFMPNSNRKCHLSNSQPPFLSLMVRDIYDYYKDKVWLCGAYEALKKEYAFWMIERMTESGLNRYNSNMTLNAEDSAAVSKGYAESIGWTPKGDDMTVAMHRFALYESGWDHNPRWGETAMYYNPVELNSLLYMFEENMAYFSIELNKRDEEVWKKRAKDRKILMNELLLSKENLFMDYNYKEKEQNDIFSAASFMPMFAGVATEEQARAAVDNLHRLEAEYGVVACEKNDYPGVYQWNYPSGWSPLQYIAVVSLDKYGYKEEAKRIAEKNVRLVEKVFDETGNIWEKYNVCEGNIAVKNQGDSAMPPMMGWSAGVYIALKDYLKNS